MTRAVQPVDRLVAGYNLLLAVVWGALVARAGYAPGIFAAHLAAGAMPWLLVRLPERCARPVAVLREFYPVLWLTSFWSELDLLRPLLHGAAFDHLVTPLDAAVFGMHPHAVWLPSMSDLWFSELMYFLYAAYYPLIFLPPVVVALAGRREALRDITFRLLGAYIGCYLVYILFPVDGPLALGTPYAGGHTAGALYRFVQRVEHAGGVLGAAFPSSHVVGAVTIAYFGWRWFSPAVAGLLSLEAVGVCLATVYTQHHYGIDAVAGLVWGLALQLVVLPVLHRWLAERPARVRVAARPEFVPLRPAAARTSGGFR